LKKIETVWRFCSFKREMANSLGRNPTAKFSYLILLILAVE